MVIEILCANVGHIDYTRNENFHFLCKDEADHLYNYPFVHTEPSLAITSSSHPGVLKDAIDMISTDKLRQLRVTHTLLKNRNVALSIQITAASSNFCSKTFGKMSVSNNINTRSSKAGLENASHRKRCCIIAAPKRQQHSNPKSQIAAT